DLHNTVRQDLYALPRQAITSLELKPVVKCGLELAVTLREQAESPYALASLLGAYTDTLSQNACRDAFAAGGINQSSVAALRLLGASYRPEDSADMLVKNVQARVLEHVRPGEPDSDGLDAAEK